MLNVATGPRKLHASEEEQREIHIYIYIYFRLYRSKVDTFKVGIGGFPAKLLSYTTPYP